MKQRLGKTSRLKILRKILPLGLTQEIYLYYRQKVRYNLLSDINAEIGAENRIVVQHQASRLRAARFISGIY